MLDLNELIIKINQKINITAIYIGLVISLIYSCNWVVYIWS